MAAIAIGQKRSGPTTFYFIGPFDDEPAAQLWVDNAGCFISDVQWSVSGLADPASITDEIVRKQDDN